MPKHVYNNVVDNRVLVDGVTVEDVMSINLPEIAFGTTEISAAGMVGTLEIPDYASLQKMNTEINHNSGHNSHYLRKLERLNIELRIARQRFDTNGATLGYEGVKVRMQVMHISSKKSEIERGNPLASTESYSVIRYEEEVDGKQTILIDIPNGIIKVNGKDYTQEYANLLN